MLGMEVRHGQETVRIELALDSPLRLEAPVESPLSIRMSDLRDQVTDKLPAFCSGPGS